MPNEIKQKDHGESNRQLCDVVGKIAPAIENAANAVKSDGRFLRGSQIAVIVATFILALFAYLQFKAVRSSIEQSQHQFSLSERPWVGLVDLKINDIEVGKLPRGTARITNAGRSPALAEIAITMSRGPNLPTPDSSLKPASSEPSRFLILPGSKISSSIAGTHEVTARHLELLLNTELYLYVWGRISYAGISGGEYQTLFCGYYSPHHTNLIACPAFNDAT